MLSERGHSCNTKLKVTSDLGKRGTYIGTCTKDMAPVKG